MGDVLGAHQQDVALHTGEGVQPIMSWKIFYGDGNTFSDRDGSPRDAPATNVQVISQSHIESGHYMQVQRDYYIYWTEDNRWTGVDLAGVMDFLVELGLMTWGDEIDSGIIIQRAISSGLVKLGRTLGRERFYEIYRIADSDPYLPKRTGFMAKEWKPGDTTR